MLRNARMNVTMVYAFFLLIERHWLFQVNVSE